MATSNPTPPIHPGVYLKQSVIPAGLSVTKAAAMLRVGRPTLSKLLNGRAALSRDMAQRFEDVFGVDGTELLEMQANYEMSKMHAKESGTSDRRFVPAYLQITAFQIVDWSKEVDARSQLPVLLRMLVHSTGAELRKVDFPGWGNSQRRGWDGQIHSGAATPWIPFGKSGWEVSCNQDPKSKAESDYEARTSTVTTSERKDITFVFVTTQNWPGKDEWARAKTLDGEWKEVKAYDASDLEQWLEQSIPAQTRFMEFAGGVPQGIGSLDQVWEEWANPTEPKLSKALFVPAFERYREECENWFGEPPKRPFVVAADSTLEGLAFLSCALDRIGESNPGVYERSIVVRSLEAFRSLPRGSTKFISIIACPEVESNLAGLQEKTHTIIVRGRSVLTPEANIELGPLNYNDLRQALQQMGCDDPDVDLLVQDSACSPTVLRRRLATIPEVRNPPWSEETTVTCTLIPLIFAGAWDSNSVDDQEVLRCLTDREYADVERTITNLLQKEEPPVWAIGNLRGVVSKIDAFYASRKSITADDLKDFFFVAEVVLSEEDPALELPEHMRWAASLYGKSRNHSLSLRQGIRDTLVLLAVHGNSLIGDRIGTVIKAEIDSIVCKLLTSSGQSTWLSQKTDLPQYAEAAPDKFLEIVEDDLKSEDPRIAELFRPVEDTFLSGCPRAGLLGALELLAWMPGYLGRVVSVLAELCKLEIDDRWTNRPSNSLQSIFRCWLPQTAAPVEKRNKALKMLVDKFPEVGWQICLSQFRVGPAIAVPSYRPRWRTDGHERVGSVTNYECWQVKRYATDLALDNFSYDTRKLIDLVENFDGLSSEDQSRVLKLVVSWNDDGQSDADSAVLRERIRCRFFARPSLLPEADEGLRDQARQIYASLEPSDPVIRHRWLFMDQWIDESSVESEVKEFDHDRHQEWTAQQRHEAMAEIWQHSGLAGVLDLCKSVEIPYSVGDCLGKILTEVEAAVDAVQSLLSVRSADLQKKIDLCVADFLMEFDRKRRNDILAELLDRLTGQERSRLRLLLCAPFDSDTWDFVDGQTADLKRQYWNGSDPFWGRYDAAGVARFVDEFLAVGRPRAAFFAARLDLELVDSVRLVRLLQESATSESESSVRHQLDSYYISQALDMLDRRGDTPREEIAQLEFLFIRDLVRTEHGIRNLEALLSEKPELFTDALVRAVKRDDGTENLDELRLPNTQDRTAVGLAAHLLLTSAKRIPGTRADGSIEPEALSEWLRDVRTRARQYGRVVTGDEMIGQLLSHCPDGDDGVWPCEPVREAIEGIASKAIAEGIVTGVYNARGVIVRMGGGEQERELADRYRRRSREIAADHPYTSSLLERIARIYDGEGEFWDMDASVRQRLGY